MLNDLLYVFLGVDGQYVRACKTDMPGGAHVSFAVDGRMDPSLLDMVNRILPIWWVPLPDLPLPHLPLLAS